MLYAGSKQFLWVSNNLLLLLFLYLHLFITVSKNKNVSVIPGTPHKIYSGIIIVAFTKESFDDTLLNIFFSDIHGLVSEYPEYFGRISNTFEIKRCVCFWAENSCIALHALLLQMG